MTWVTTNTPQQSRFLVFPNEASTAWFDDKVAEWFPALTGKTSVNTVQGYEWVPGAFTKRVTSATELWDCLNAESTCLDTWQAKSGNTFTHVFLPQRRKQPALLSGLVTDARYKLIYDGAGALVFERIDRDKTGSSRMTVWPEQLRADR
jgi:hypothetical protein